MYNIKTLNSISPIYKNTLSSMEYNVSADAENPQAILVRSADMHSYEINDDLLCVARAGAGVNNLPLDRMAQAGVVAFNTPGANSNAVKELVLAGLLLYAYVLYLSAPHMSRIIGNVLGGMLVSAVCVLCHALGLGHSLSHMIIGAIMPLIPGIPFTNGVRDLADGDYISGSVRLLDALLTFVCIATGVGVVISFYHQMTGGGLL